MYFLSWYILFFHYLILWDFPYFHLMTPTIFEDCQSLTLGDLYICNQIIALFEIWLKSWNQRNHRKLKFCILIYFRNGFAIYRIWSKEFRFPQSEISKIGNSIIEKSHQTRLVRFSYIYIYVIRPLYTFPLQPTFWHYVVFPNNIYIIYKIRSRNQFKGTLGQLWDTLFVI